MFEVPFLLNDFLSVSLIYSLGCVKIFCVFMSTWSTIEMCLVGTVHELDVQ
jgi:hypothetical protein